MVAGAIAPALRMSVKERNADSTGVNRARNAVIGAAIGAVGGALLGVHRARVADAQCGSECGGPPIDKLIYPPLFALLGAAAGAIVGYFITP